MLKVSRKPDGHPEIFYSVQGEGVNIGKPAVFLRLGLCNLKCIWCDTKYAWDWETYNPKEQLIDMPLEDIERKILAHKCKYFVVTGGEPMINSELPELVQKLKALGKHITIETAGIAFVPDMACDLMSIAPKLRNSIPTQPELAAIHEDSRLDLAVLGELIDNYNYQLKFVVDSEDDLTEIKEIIETLNNVDSSKVMLMPQAKTRKELLARSPVVAEICKRSGFVFSPRLQVMLWNNEKGT